MLGDYFIWLKLIEQEQEDNQKLILDRWVFAWQLYGEDLSAEIQA